MTEPASCAGSRGSRRRRAGRPGGRGGTGRARTCGRSLRGPAATGGRAGSFLDRPAASGSIIASTSAWAAARTWPTFAAGLASPICFAAIDVLHFFAPEGRAHRPALRRRLPAPLHLAPAFLRLRLSDGWRSAGRLPGLYGGWLGTRPAETEDQTIGRWLVRRAAIAGGNRAVLGSGAGRARWAKASSGRV